MTAKHHFRMTLTIDGIGSQVWMDGEEIGNDLVAVSVNAEAGELTTVTLTYSDVTVDLEVEENR